MSTFTITRTWEEGTNQVVSLVTAEADGVLKLEATVANADDGDLTGALDVSESVHIWIMATVNMTLKTNATNEAQTITITGTPTGGTFTVTYSGQTTSALAYNATAADLKTALEALSNIATDDVACSGGPFPATGVTVEFRKALGATNVSQMTSTSSLTGGAPVITHATTTAGVAASQSIALVANQAIDWNSSDGFFSNPLTTDITKILVVNDSGGSGSFYFYALYNP